MQNSLDELFASARQATPPALDVADRVCATLRTGRVVPISDKPLWIAASLSLAIDGTRRRDNASDHWVHDKNTREQRERYYRGRGQGSLRNDSK
jgi:hypothetical protein